MKELMRLCRNRVSDLDEAKRWIETAMVLAGLVHNSQAASEKVSGGILAGSVDPPTSAHYCSLARPFRSARCINRSLRDMVRKGTEQDLAQTFLLVCRLCLFDSRAFTCLFIKSLYTLSGPRVLLAFTVPLCVSSSLLWRRQSQMHSCILSS